MCYEILALSCELVNFCQCHCHFLGEKSDDENYVYFFLTIQFKNIPLYTLSENGQVRKITKLGYFS
jgi:hypothetical protein